MLAWLRAARLQHAELPWADARPDHVGAFAPYCSGAEA